MAALALLVGGCVGDVMPAETSTLTASAQRPKDAGVRRDGGGKGMSPDERACPDDLERPVAAGMSVSQVALYQTLKVALYEGGAWQTDRNAPIIQGKRALVRVFAELLPEYQSHPVQGVLRLKNGDEVIELVDERELGLDSTDGDIESTFNFEVPAARLGPNTQFAVSLEEPDCEAEGGDPFDVRLPKSGTKALKAEATGKLRVVMVPIVVDGRLPVLTDEQRANIRAALLAFYPVGDVELGVHSPIDFVGNADAKDSAALLDELLRTVREQRKADRPDDDVYYVGTFQPAPSFRVFCESGCVLGLAPQNINVQPVEQIAVGAFFADSRGYETIVHELGHAHGRGHSPCDTGIVPRGIDANYPRRDGSTGEWGWDFRTGGLVPPTNKDIMGYCNPTWMSAYHYEALAVRSRAVNLPKPAVQTQALIRGESARDRYRSLLLRSDGKARWERAIETSQPREGRERAVVLDAAGAVLAEIDVVRTALTHTGGEFVSIPEPGPGWHAIEWTGRRIELGAILPPR